MTDGTEVQYAEVVKAVTGELETPEKKHFFTSHAQKYRSAMEEVMATQDMELAQKLYAEIDADFKNWTRTTDYVFWKRKETRKSAITRARKELEPDVSAFFYARLDSYLPYLNMIARALEKNETGTGERWYQDMLDKARRDFAEQETQNAATAWEVIKEELQRQTAEDN